MNWKIFRSVLPLVALVASAHGSTLKHGRRSTSPAHIDERRQREPATVTSPDRAP